MHGVKELSKIREDTTKGKIRGGKHLTNCYKQKGSETAYPHSLFEAYATGLIPAFLP